ncbi:MAG TPA: DUF2149 domain-containing protein [bacterium]|nr:DUF2149 domain-containing protein [bacterium]
MIKAGNNKRGRNNRIWKSFMRIEDEDPMSLVANLFDVAMVFAVALLLAMVMALNIPEMLMNKEEITILKNPGKPNMEIITKKGIKLEKYKISREETNGEGKRLGVCYRLKNGEVVYIPDSGDE